MADSFENNLIDINSKTSNAHTNVCGFYDDYELNYNSLDSKIKTCSSITEYINNIKTQTSDIKSDCNNVMKAIEEIKNLYIENLNKINNLEKEVTNTKVNTVNLSLNNNWQVNADIKDIKEKMESPSLIINGNDNVIKTDPMNPVKNFEKNTVNNNYDVHLTYDDYLSDEISSLIKKPFTYFKENYVSGVKSTYDWIEKKTLDLLNEYDTYVEDSIDEGLEKNPNASISWLKIKANGTAIGKTILNAGVQIIKGVIGFPEKAADVILQIISSDKSLNALGLIFNWDQSDIDFIQKDLIQSIADERTKNVEDKYIFQKVVNGEGTTVQEWLDDNSLVKSDNFGGQICQSIGEQLAVILLTSGVSTTFGLTGTAYEQAVSKCLFATQCFGSSVEAAYKEGANHEEASLYATLSTLVETSTEFISGGVGGSDVVSTKDALETFMKSVDKDVNNKLLNSLVKTISSLGYSFISEGSEEVLSDVIQPYILKLTYLKDESIVDIYSEYANFRTLANDFLAGGISGGIISTSSKVISKVNNSNNNSSLNNQNLSIDEIVNFAKNNNLMGVDSDFDAAVSQWESLPDSMKKTISEMYINSNSNINTQVVENTNQMNIEDSLVNDLQTNNIQGISEKQIYDLNKIASIDGGFGSITVDSVNDIPKDIWEQITRPLNDSDISIVTKKGEIYYWGDPIIDFSDININNINLAENFVSQDSQLEYKKTDIKEIVTYAYSYLASNVRKYLSIDINNISGMPEKILNQGILHFTNNAEGIISSGYVKPTNAASSYTLFQKRSYFFDNVPTLGQLATNLSSKGNIPIKLEAVRFQVETEKLNSNGFKMRYFDDGAISYDGKYEFNKENASKEYYCLTNNNGNYEYTLVSKDIYDSFDNSYEGKNAKDYVDKNKINIKSEYLQSLNSNSFLEGLKIKLNSLSSVSFYQRISNIVNNNIEVFRRIKDNGNTNYIQSTSNNKMFSDLVENFNEFTSKNKFKSSFEIFDNEFSNTSQYDTNDILKFIKDSDLDSMIDTINSEIISEGLNQDPNSIHNQQHIFDVVMFAGLLGKLNNLDIDVIKILMEAAKYHDSGRVNDKNISHAVTSAINYEQNGNHKDFNSVEQNIIKAMIEFHEIDRSNSNYADIEFNKIVNKYNISQDNVAFVRYLSELLKDADALDRTRFQSNSRTKYSLLKDDISKQLMKFSADNQDVISYNKLINNNINMKKIYNFEDCELSKILAKKYGVNGITMQTLALVQDLNSFNQELLNNAIKNGNYVEYMFLKLTSVGYPFLSYNSGCLYDQDVINKMKSTFKDYFGNGEYKIVEKLIKNKDSYFNRLNTELDDTDRLYSYAFQDHIGNALNSYLRGQKNYMNLDTTYSGMNNYIVKVLYDALNHHLLPNNGSINTQLDVNSYVEAMDNIINNPVNTLSEDIYVFHGTDGLYLNNNELDITLIEPGDVINDSGYFSTSATSNTSYINRKDIVLKIKLPAGCQAYSINENGSNYKMQEILLNRGSSFKVLTKPIKGSDGKYYVELELLV